MASSTLTIGPQPGVVSQSLVLPNNRTMGTAATEAWHKHVAKLDKDEIDIFDQYSCDDLKLYLQKIQLHCTEQRQTNRTFRLFEFVKPLYDFTALLVPGVTTAVQAYPNPGCLIMGGIVLVLQVTEAARAYQRMILQTLDSMSSRVGILLEYDVNIYEDEPNIQKALVDVYGHMLEFCYRAFRYVTRDGALKRELKALGIMLLHTFKTDLRNIVKIYESDLQNLEAKALTCDKKRIKIINESAKSQGQTLNNYMSTTEQHFKMQKNLIQQHERRAEAYRRRQEGLRNQKNYRKLLDWLSNLDFETSFVNTCESKHLPGTGQWLLENDTYQRWKYGDGNQIVWVNGKPGCGKSVLAAVTISDLLIEVNSTVGLAYALCSSDESAKQDPTLILRNLVRQLLAQRSATNPKLEQLRQQTIHPRNGPTFVEAKGLFFDALSLFSLCYLVIDALDECRNSTQLTKLFTSLVDQYASSLNVRTSPSGKKAEPRLKIIVFSRHHSELTNALGQYDKIPLDDGLNDGDLTEYIHSLFPEEPPADLNSRIRNECLRKANGMFLWVKLVHQGLVDAIYPESKLEIIKDTPRDLPPLYNRILTQIAGRHPDHKKIAYLVLLWIENAGRPLSGPEMVEAVADYSKALQKAQVFIISSADQLVSICQHLVTIGKDGLFRLCHDSLRNYLHDMQQEMPRALIDYQEQQKNSKERLARISISYLQLSDFRRGPARSGQELQKLFDQHAFLRYLSIHLQTHLSADVESIMHGEVLQLIDSSNTRDLLMQFWRSEYSPGLKYRRIRSGATALHLLAILGFQRIAEELSTVEDLSKGVDAWGYLPLHFALLAKQREMCFWLIELASPLGREQLNAGGTLSFLHYASSFGWTEVVRKVLTIDSDINGKAGPNGKTALYVACEAGRADIVTTLLKNGADSNIENDDEDRPLIAAVQKDNLEIVRLLLQHGARVNDTDRDGAAALHYAFNNSSLIHILLDHDADPSLRATKRDGASALHFAAGSGAVETLSILYQVDPEPQAQSDSGYTALHFATRNNKPDSIRTLLELGAIITMADVDGDTPLHIAVQLELLESIIVLMESRPSITGMINNRGRTPLHDAVESGRLDVTELLLESQPRDTWKSLCNLPSKSGQTPLHIAVDGGNLDVLKLLLETGADTSRLGVFNSTALHYAAHFNHSSMIEPLIQHGVDINARNKHEHTALHFASRKGHTQFVREMFNLALKYELVLEVDAQDSRGRTALQSAILGDHAETAEFLIEQKSTSIPDLQGDYPIHAASKRGLDSVIHLLANHESASIKGFQSRSPVLYGAFAGKESAVKILLDHAPEMIDEPDQDGYTPVQAAFRSKGISLIHYLLDYFADPYVKNASDQTLLHEAAVIGDKELFERLLNLKCPATAADRLGVTPYMLAAHQGNQEILELLIAHGVNQHEKKTHLGYTSLMLAASEGQLEVCRFLRKCGADILTSNELGFTATYIAAAEGQFEVLKYLESQGGCPDIPLISNHHALTFAASSGFVQTVIHLIRAYPHLVNKVNPLDGSTPLNAAAASRRATTVTKLLNAGADHQYEDELGLSAYDYAISHPSISKAMQQASVCHIPLHSRQLARYQKLRQTTVDCCESMLLVLEEQSSVAAWQRLFRLRGLAAALRHLQDYDNAVACCLELCYPLEAGPYWVTYTCDLCSQKADETLHICKSCLTSTILCHDCYLDYQKSALGDDDTLVETTKCIKGLEISVQVLRFKTSINKSLQETALAFKYFPDFCGALGDILEQYETWEGKHNADGRFNSFSRPGQKWLTLVVGAVDLLNNVNYLQPDSPEHTHFQKLEQDYSDLNRCQRADQEPTDFICRDHEYFTISLDEKRKLQADGQDLDPTTGKLTASFLQRLRDHYIHQLILHASGETVVSEVRSRSPSIGQNAAQQSVNEVLSNQALSFESEPFALKDMKRSNTDTQQKLARIPSKSGAGAAVAYLAAMPSMSEHIPFPTGLTRSQSLPNSVMQGYQHTTGKGIISGGPKSNTKLRVNLGASPENIVNFGEHRTLSQSAKEHIPQHDGRDVSRAVSTDAKTDIIRTGEVANANGDWTSDQLPQHIDTAGTILASVADDSTLQTHHSVTDPINDETNTLAEEDDQNADIFTREQLIDILVALGYPRDELNLELFIHGLQCVKTLMPDLVDDLVRKMSNYLEDKEVETKA